MNALFPKSPDRKAASSPLRDSWGRDVHYLRLSVTDRCDFRCVYCMSDNMIFQPKPEMLSLDELDRLCEAFIGLGVRKIRITGGEPLVRRNVIWLFQQLGRHLQSGALDELTLTSNGSQLEDFAGPLAAAGVRRINVSLDSLDPGAFRAITRRGDLQKVLAGIDAALQAGIRIKINMVALKERAATDIPAMMDWCCAKGLDLTFIEVMPMGDMGGESRLNQFLPLTAVREMLEQRYNLLESAERSGGPARYVRVEETGQKLGFISPLTGNFCESCNRVRVSCLGQLYGCLGQNDMVDLRAPLRSSDENGPVIAAIRNAISRKPKGHDFVIKPGQDGPAVPRHMSATGG